MDYTEHPDSKDTGDSLVPVCLSVCHFGLAARELLQDRPWSFAPRPGVSVTRSVRGVPEGPWHSSTPLFALRLQVDTYHRGLITSSNFAKASNRNQTVERDQCLSRSVRQLRANA